MRPRTLQMCVTPHPANVGDIASSKCGNHRALQMCEPPHPKCRDACNASASNEGNILTQHTRSPAHPAHKVTCAPSSTSPRSPQPTRAGQFAGFGRIACVPTLWVRGHA